MWIRTEDDANAFLRSVHDFHDGFIRRIAVTSADSFEIDDGDDVAHVLTGRLDAEIEFVRHPTVAGFPPKPGVTRCRFHDVADVRIDLSGIQGVGWPLYAVAIRAAGSDRLSLSCRWGDGAERCLFTFAEMEVLER